MNIHDYHDLTATINLRLSVIAAEWGMPLPEPLSRGAVRVVIEEYERTRIQPTQLPTPIVEVPATAAAIVTETGIPVSVAGKPTLIKQGSYTWDEIAAVVRSIYAKYGACSNSMWDKNRPAHLPTSGAIRLKLKMNWQTILEKAIAENTEPQEVTPAPAATFRPATNGNGHH